METRADKGLAFMLQYENVAWYESGKVRILDRRIYPRKVEFVTCHSYGEVAQAIKDMVTQSAGPYTAAGMGMALAAYQCRDRAESDQSAFMEEAAKTIAYARPTTANRMKQITHSCLEVAKVAKSQGKDPAEEIFLHTLGSLERRYGIMSKVATHLVDRFPEKPRVMTQCFGETIVGTMLREAQNRNLEVRLFCPETRPYLQGARLTASVARDMAVDVTVITDNMGAVVMKEKGIHLFTSAADSICLDGHIVNKVGTLQLAIVAKYFGLPYYVTGIPDGDKTSVQGVVIEERNPQEVLMAGGVKHTMEGVKGYYPSFDITPPSLISGIVTDKGVYPPLELRGYFDTKVENFYSIEKG